MVAEILPGLYRIEIPLPKNPLRALNAYLIKGPERFLLIDTGMNREECLRAMTTGLEELKVDLDRTDFFITHRHADHLGLAPSLARDTSKVYFGRNDAQTVWEEQADEEAFFHKRAALYLANGFPEEDLKVAKECLPGRRFGPKKHIDFSTVDDGDRIEIGDYSFRCIETPGHSKGHMCLYEPVKKLLISGDHILFDITPNITCWINNGNSLKHYLLSLEKVYSLDVDLVLPGHRSIMPNLKKRIREIQAHHQARVGEVIAFLREGEKTAIEIAPHITWNISETSWDLFPIQQRWSAFGETMAHLYYIEDAGIIGRRVEDHRILYSLAGNGALTYSQ